MNEEAKRRDEVTPKGVVEIGEKELDQAAGGQSDFHRPADVALTDEVNALGKAGQKTVPQDPSIGLLSDPQKKL